MIDREEFDAYAVKLGLFEGRKQCFLYLMRCDRFTKVGIAADVERRRAKLQATNPRPVTIAKQFSFGGRQYALLAEQSAHKRLAEFRGHGEWFGGDYETILSVVQDEADVARKLMRARTLHLKKEYADLWGRYLTDKALQDEVHTYDARLSEIRRRDILRQRALHDFGQAYQNGDFDKGRVR